MQVLKEFHSKRAAGYETCRISRISQQVNSCKMSEITRNVALSAYTRGFGFVCKKFEVLAAWDCQSPQCKNIENPINNVCVFIRQCAGCFTLSTSALLNFFFFNRKPFLMVFCTCQILLKTRANTTGKKIIIIKKNKNLAISRSLSCY